MAALAPPCPCLTDHRTFLTSTMHCPQSLRTPFLGTWPARQQAQQQHQQQQHVRLHSYSLPLLHPSSPLTVVRAQAAEQPPNPNRIPPAHAASTGNSASIPLPPASAAAASRRGSVASRAAVTSQPMPDSGGFFRVQSPGPILQKLFQAANAAAIAVPLKFPQRTAEPPAPTIAKPTVADSASGAAAAAGNAVSAAVSTAVGARSPAVAKSSVATGRKARSGWNSDLHISRALPLPMMAPNSQPLPMEAVEDMIRCDPEMQDCKEVVYQWTGKCTRCSGTGYVTFRRKRGKDFTGTCITCSGIGYVQRFTIRDSIRVMEEIEDTWRP